MKLHKAPPPKSMQTAIAMVASISLGVVLFVAELSGFGMIRAAIWVFVLAALFVALWLIWYLIFHEGIFTWRARAFGPIKAHQLGQYDKADKLFNEQMDHIQQLPANDFRRGMQLTILADYLSTAARFQEAKPLYQEALRIFLDRLEKRPSDYMVCLNNLAVRHLAWRERDAAKALLDQANLTLQPFTWNRQLQTMMAILHHNQAVTSLQLEDLEGARTAIEEGEDALPYTSVFQRGMVRAYLAGSRARYHVLRHEWDQAERVLKDIQPKYRPIVQGAHADLLMARGQFEAAETSLSELIAKLKRDTTPDHPSLIEPYEMLTGCLLEQHRTGEAVKSLAEVRAIRAKHQIALTPDWQRRLREWGPKFRSQGRDEIASELEAEAMVEGPGSTHFRA